MLSGEFEFEEGVGSLGVEFIVEERVDMLGVEDTCWRVVIYKDAHSFNTFTGVDIWWWINMFFKRKFTFNKVDMSWGIYAMWVEL